MRLSVCALGVVLLAGCKRHDVSAESERRNQWVKTLAYREDAGQSWELSSRDTVVLGDGWGPMEHMVAGDTRSESWRWLLGQHGIVRLDTSGGPHHLVIGGGLPPGAGFATITFTIDGEVRDVHVVDKGWRLDTIVAPSSRRWIELAVNASSTTIPPGDNREMGASLTVLRWDPVAP